MSRPLIDRFYSAYNGHAVEDVRALYAEDACHEDIAHGRPKTGRDAIADGFAYFLRLFPDAHWEVKDQAISGPIVTTSYVLTGSLQAPMGKTPGNGQRISLRGVHLLEVRDDLIVRSEDYWDANSFHRQINND